MPQGVLLVAAADLVHRLPGEPTMWNASSTGIVGARADPEDFAVWAADWLERQLRRPVVRDEWLAGNEVVATTWRLEDTGRVLGRDGFSVDRIRRREPDRRTRVR